MSKDGPIYNKFRVERIDGQSEPGQKHATCRYFVLDLDCDHYAGPALMAYADACENTHPQLAEDIRKTCPIPKHVYFRSGNFYDAGNRMGMGHKFYGIWKHRAADFPTTPGG